MKQDAEYYVHGHLVTVQELKDVLVAVPEITQLLGNDEASKILSQDLNGYVDAKSFLQLVFTKLMTASKEAVSELVSKLKARLDLENKVYSGVQTLYLLLKLCN